MGKDKKTAHNLGSLHNVLVYDSPCVTSPCVLLLDSPFEGSISRLIHVKNHIAKTTLAQEKIELDAD